MSEQIVDLIEALPQPGPRGLQGERGPQGLPGVNAVPADEAVASYLSAVDSKSHAAVDALLPVLLRDVVIQRDNTSLMVPRRRVYLNCTFDRDYPDEQMKSADDMVFVNCRFLKPAGRLWTMSGRDERKGLARATFVNCTFKGSYSSGNDDFRNHQIVFDQFAGLSFTNCGFRDVGVRVQASGETGRLVGTLTMSGCRFERTAWDVYRTIGDETSADFSHKEFVSVPSKYLCCVSDCVFDGANSRWDSLDLYNCWGANVSDTRFYAGDQATCCEVKSIYDGASSGTWGNETNITGEQVQVTFSDCWFVGGEDAANWIGVGAITYYRNGYDPGAESRYTGKRVYLDRCLLWGRGGSMAAARGTNVVMRDCKVDKVAAAPNRLVTLEADDRNDMDTLVRLDRCEGSIAWRTWPSASRTRLEACDCVLYLIVIDDSITFSNVSFNRCRFNPGKRVMDSSYGCYSGAAGTIVMRDCEYTSFRLAKGSLTATGCRMDSLGVWDSMRLEHCHTRDVNTGAIAGRVEYRDLTYTDGTPDKTKLTPINIKEVTMAKSIGGGA